MKSDLVNKMKASLQKSYCKGLPSKVEHCSGLRSIQLLLTPALLCHKYTAQGMQNSFIGGHFSLCLYGMRAPIIDSFCAWKPLIMHRPWRQHMYLVTFRNTVSISTNESAPLCYRHLFSLQECLWYFPDGWNESDAVTQHDDDHDVDADFGDQNLTLPNPFL